jgi:hypothetical protein
MRGEQLSIVNCESSLEMGAGMKSRTLLAGLILAGAGVAGAQQPQPATPLPVGTDAPDFTLPSATKDGVGQPVSLHQYRGKVIVLAFFFRARTSG